jgi:hypothetical protein
MRKTRGVWQEHVSETAIATTHTFYSDYVPQDEFWYVRTICLMKQITAATAARIYIDAGTHLHPIGYSSMATGYVLYFNAVEGWLREGERIRVDFTTVISGDVLQMFIMGVKSGVIAL